MSSSESDPKKITNSEPVPHLSLSVPDFPCPRFSITKSYLAVSWELFC